MSHSGPLFRTGTNSVEAFLKYLQVKYKHLASVTLTYDLQNLIRSSLSPSGPSYQIWRFYLKAFPRYYVLKHGADKHDITVTLTFDLWPPKSNRFILESQWTLVQSLKKIPQSVLEISRSQEICCFQLAVLSAASSSSQDCAGCHSNAVEHPIWS